TAKPEKYSPNTTSTPPATTGATNKEAPAAGRGKLCKQSRDSSDKHHATHHKSGAEGIRTPDLLVANETRYPLRHSPGTVAILHSLLAPNRSGTCTALSAPKTSPAQSSKWLATP